MPTGCANPAPLSGDYCLYGCDSPEAIEATGLMSEDRRDIGLLAVTSADRLNAGWTAAQKRVKAGFLTPIAISNACWPMFLPIAVSLRSLMVTRQRLAGWVQYTDIAHARSGSTTSGRPVLSPNFTVITVSIHMALYAPPSRSARANRSGVSDWSERSLRKTPLQLLAPRVLPVFKRKSRIPARLEYSPLFPKLTSRL